MVELIDHLERLEKCSHPCRRLFDFHGTKQVASYIEGRFGCMLQESTQQGIKFLTKASEQSVVILVRIYQLRMFNTHLQSRSIWTAKISLMCWPLRV